MNVSIFQWASFPGWGNTTRGIMKIDDEFIEFPHPHNFLDSEEINAQMMRLEKKLNQCQSSTTLRKLAQKKR